MFLLVLCIQRFFRLLQICFIFLDLKLFGYAYSGLEYDYRGLIHVYEMLQDDERFRNYSLILSNWKDLREQHALLDTEPLALSECPRPLDKVKELFFESLKPNVKLNSC